MRTLKRMTVIHGIPVTKCLIIKSHITDRNSGRIPPQTINTGQDLPMSATYLCKITTVNFPQKSMCEKNQITASVGGRGNHYPVKLHKKKKRMSSQQPKLLARFTEVSRL